VDRDNNLKKVEHQLELILHHYYTNSRDIATSITTSCTIILNRVESCLSWSHLFLTTQVLFMQVIDTSDFGHITAAMAIASVLHQH